MRTKFILFVGFVLSFVFLVSHVMFAEEQNAGSLTAGSHKTVTFIKDMENVYRMFGTLVDNWKVKSSRIIDNKPHWTDECGGTRVAASASGFDKAKELPELFSTTVEAILTKEGTGDKIPKCSITGKSNFGFSIKSTKPEEKEDKIVVVWGTFTQFESFWDDEKSKHAPANWSITGAQGQNITNVSKISIAKTGGNFNWDDFEGGEYTVNATRGDNYDTMKLEVIKLKITYPEENDVYLHGSKCKFEAEIKPDSYSIDEWNWEIIEGKGNPVSGEEETFEPIVLNEDASFDTIDELKVKLTAKVNSETISTERKIKVVYPRIKEIDFTDVAKEVILEGDWRPFNPEWTVDRKEKSRCVYVQGSTVKIKAKFEIKESLTNETEITKLYASGNKTGTSSESSSKNISDTETVIDLAGNTVLPKKIFAYEGHNGNEVKYIWEYKINGNKYTIAPKPSDNKHHMYSVFKQPLTNAYVFETVLYITCRAASGENEADGTTAKIWGEFTPPLTTMERIDGEKLKYWGEGANTSGQSTFQLLFNTDGRCGAWGRFFLGALKTHGIPGKLREIKPFTRIDTIMLIKNWKFAQHINSGRNRKFESLRLPDDFALFEVGDFTPRPNYPSIFPEENGKIDSIERGDDKKSSGVLRLRYPVYRFFPYTRKWGNNGPEYGRFWGDAFELDGVAGQNSEDPPESFKNHAIVTSNNLFYDPSYGLGPFSDNNQGLIQYENKALTGFSFSPTGGNEPFAIRLNQPGRREIKKGRTFDIAY